MNELILMNQCIATGKMNDTILAGMFALMLNDQNGTFFVYFNIGIIHRIQKTVIVPVKINLDHSFVIHACSQKCLTMKAL